MSNVAALIADMVRAGVDPDLIGRTAEALCGSECAPARTARQERNARYYQKRRASENRLNASEQDDSTPPSSSPPTPPLTTPTRNITPRPPTGDGLPTATTADLDQALVEWNRLAEQCGLKSVRRLNPGRKAALAARLREEGMDGWRRVLAQIRGSPFLLGQKGRGWKATFDFAISDRGYTRISEAQYEENTTVIQPKEWSVTDFLREGDHAEQHSADDADDVPRVLALRR